MIKTLPHFITNVIRGVGVSGFVDLSGSFRVAEIVLMIVYTPLAVMKLRKLITSI